MALPRFPVPAPGFQPRTAATLLSSATPLPTEWGEDGTARRWLGGVTFQPFGCTPLQRVAAAICEPDDEELPYDYEYRSLLDPIGFDTFEFYDAITGTTICANEPLLLDDIEIKFPAMVSEQLALELMSGGVRPYIPPDDETGVIMQNANFAAVASVVPGGPFRPEHALAALEQAIADRLHGNQGTLHLTPYGMSLTGVLGELSKASGDRVTTGQGNLLIADAGYLGPEPAAASADADEWWYASGQVFYKITQPTDIGDRMSRIDISTNRIEQVRQGQAILIFDPCAVVAVPVCYESDCVGS